MGGLGRLLSIHALKAHTDAIETKSPPVAGVQAMAKKKRIPMRTCVQCREVRPKRELIRVVRTPEGEIGIDERGKAAGRGAYLCHNGTCWEAAVGGDRLDYALKMKLKPEHKQQLSEYGERLPRVDAQES